MLFGPRCERDEGQGLWRAGSGGSPGGARAAGGSNGARVPSTRGGPFVFAPVTGESASCAVAGAGRRLGSSAPERRCGATGPDAAPGSRLERGILLSSQFEPAPVWSLRRRRWARRRRLSRGDGPEEGEVPFRSLYGGSGVRDPRVRRLWARSRPVCLTGLRSWRGWGA